ncbi:MAG: hypothetical protein IKO83_01900 [Oscillospiraceae bacterium]|nr:hypothetical protein [Oscillospiraceae bacterium]
MDILVKASALLLVSSLIGLLIRRNSPELSLLINLASVTVVFLLSCSVAGDIRNALDKVSRLTQSAGTYTYPVLKCLAIAALTRVSSELCRDASQGAASSAVELMGTLCALSVAMPLIMSVVQTIGGLL